MKYRAVKYSDGFYEIQAKGSGILSSWFKSANPGSFDRETVINRVRQLNSPLKYVKPFIVEIIDVRK